MIQHKTLIGDQAGVYLPFARSRLRALQRTLGEDAYFSQKYTFNGYRIEVRQLPPLQFIRITQEGLGIAYEFFTSEHINDSTLSSPDHFHGGVDGFVCGSALRATFATPNASAGGTVNSAGRYSTVFTPGSNDSWKLRDCEAPQGSDTGLYTWPAWQQQKFFEHAWHPSNDGKSLVTSTQAQAPGLAGQCNWMSPYSFARIASAGSKVSDFGPDVKPTLYTAGGTKSGAPQLDQEWIYWRRAAVQSSGGRQFFISTDNYGRFQIYPVKDYPSDIVPLGSYKQYTPNYPGWVTVPDPTDYRWQVNDWLWRFNKDATKCVSIPFNSDFTNGFYKTLANFAFFATLLPARAAGVSIPSALLPAHEDVPGLVEFGIAITVTGTGDLDFDVEFTVLRQSYFIDHGRFFFDAAYFLKDVETIGVVEDTLVTAEVECTYPSGFYSANSGEGSPYNLDLARGVKTDFVLYTNADDLTKTEKLRFTGMTGGQGKFPTLAKYIADGSGAVTEGGVSGPVAFTVGGTLDIASAGPVTNVIELVGGVPAGATFGRLYALELSTLSALYEVDDEVAGTGYLRGISYGTEFYRYDYGLGYTKPASILPASDQVMPSARWYQYALDGVLNTEWGMGFSVHPLGHWSFAVNAELGRNVTLRNALDWISVKGKDSTGAPTRFRFRHKDLFNKAFSQTRDYDFYTTSFPGEGLWDQGSFRTQGIWVTFR